MFGLRRKSEKRQVDATDVIVQQIQSQANNQNAAAVPGATAAVEIASGIIQRAFMSARLDGVLQDIGLNQAVFGSIGRALARRGECVFMIRNRPNLSIVAANTHDIRGGYEVDTWRYDLTFQGPSKSLTIRGVRSQDVLHFRWSYDLSTPWVGVGPLQSASLDARLLGAVVKGLGDECLSPSGAFLPVPKTGGDDQSVALLKGDIKAAGGSILLVESMSDAWQSGGSGQVNHDWTVRRFGADPPDSLLKVYRQAHNAVLEAYGLSSALLADSTGTGSRESWRIALFGLINPLAKMIQSELSEKLGLDVNLEFDELRASDLQGRARGFKALVEGGMSVERALQVSGFG